jgi:predicted ATP-binding protein involved in virulence
MKQMKFSKLSLLSQKEQRGLQLGFTSPRTVLVAGNGCGKSAILKSLYETLGALTARVGGIAAPDIIAMTSER